MSRTYPAKLLLFGEYSVLSGSQALAVPLTQWSGYWTNEYSGVHDSSLEFFKWLFDKSIIDQEDKNRMKADAEEGWRFSSSIPIGHGVGSSGAYVAAVYDRYLAEKRHVEDANPSTIMANMEAYFHGSSSGMDPLVSIENKAVLKDDAGGFHVINDPGWPEGFKVYLWDSGIARTTGPLVNAYKNKIQDPEFLDGIQRILIPMVDHAIHFYLSRTPSMLEQCINIISKFQRIRFKEMIPDEVKIVWEKVMEKKGVYMKLCGAGGGGFYMIISTEGEPVVWPGIIQLH